MEEEKTTQPDQEKPEIEAEQAPADTDIESRQAEEEERDSVATAHERRGRWIVAGLTAAAAATVVAVVVAGIFQFTSRWLTQCPRDRTANGPAQVLWKDVISDKSPSQPLGVPKELLQTTKLKSPPVTQELNGGKNENQ
jgi:hypothetical protein